MLARSDTPLEFHSIMGEILVPWSYIWSHKHDILVSRNACT